MISIYSCSIVLGRWLELQSMMHIGATGLPELLSTKSAANPRSFGISLTECVQYE